MLDPIMILRFGWGIRGAAIATVIGNAAGAAYYLLYFRHGNPNISIDPRDLTCVGETSANVLSIGVPAALGPMLMSVSQVVMNSLMSDYGSLLVAAAGIASKTTIIIGTVAIGIGQGVQPLLGYSVGARNWKRYRQYMKSSLLFALTVCLIMTVFCCLFAKDIAGTFLSKPDNFRYAVTFVYILQSTAFLFGIFYCFANALQAMGAATQSLIINVSRQGLIYIPALFALRALFGMNGLILAQPLADISSLVLAVVLHGVAFRRLETFYPVLRNKNTSVRDE